MWQKTYERKKITTIVQLPVTRFILLDLNCHICTTRSTTQWYSWVLPLWYYHWFLAQKTTKAVLQEYHYRSGTTRVELPEQYYLYASDTNNANHPLIFLNYTCLFKLQMLQLFKGYHIPLWRTQVKNPRCYGLLV